MLTFKENVKAILESNFAGFKEEIIDLAAEKICSLKTITDDDDDDDEINIYVCTRNLY